MFIAKINVWTLIFLCIGKATSTETEAKEDLVQSESKDGTLEIIKQIKKVNNDGSYTVGYEADDGSFKIESRDVLGNIKGTYGYIDDSGKIKRVSYSSTNSTDIVHHVEGDSVVQRIPKLNRTFVSSTTNRPYHSTTASSIQNLVKKKHGSSSTTASNIDEDSAVKSTTKTHLVYATTPRSRFLLKSAEDSQQGKHEGQLPRPEELDRPTELPLFRRLSANHPATEIKPVTEEPELKSNILRRQLPRENDFDPHQHVHTLQQSLGSDSPDVYSASMTTGTPRPLFTTTYRPIRLSTTAVPIRRATVRYPKNLQSSAQHKEETTPSKEEEESDEPSSVSETTPSSIPVVQIPANRPQPETLVAIRHPYQRNTVLVPLSQLQRRLVPFASPRDINDNIQGYVPQLEQYAGEPTSNPSYNQEAPRSEYARRIPPPLRPMPVQIDENGYVREYPQQSFQQKYVAVPVSVPQKYEQEVSSNTIENIQPPVSIRDFQIILQQLELRQKRLERIHELTDPRRNVDYQQKRNFEPNQFYHRFAQNNPSNTIQFIPNPDAQRRRQYQSISTRQFAYQHPQNQYEDEQFAQSYVPTKRVARLLKNSGDEGSGEEYLPADVREMLLLKMLQLAINPALPNDNEESETTTSNYFKKDPSRNVEILGEEQEPSRRPSRVKRFKETEDLEYTD
ncbi:uncharacterized protein LOC123315782 [Coccinella septempunctata]|uniref:uncharacterized protein LOC123315782 n=1 Tax=Coccinella septempunctata TaxID=41139 RepID=UPI001D06B7B6|nr:uncharacterized protein LOC123315782 [Coccinella septempunctata]